MSPEGLGLRSRYLTLHARVRLGVEAIHADRARGAGGGLETVGSGRDVRGCVYCVCFRGNGSVSSSSLTTL